MRRLQISILLFLVYLALSGNATLPNLVIGSLAALLVAALLPGADGPAYSWKRIPRFLLALLRYILFIISDIIKGAISTSRIVLDPKLPINPGIILIPSGSKTELGAALSAHAISLSPGELVVEMDDQGNIYVHCLDIDNSAQYSAEAQVLRRDLLSEMFE